MSEKAYEVAHIDDLDRFPIDNDELLWRPVRRKLGITAFGTNAYTAEKGHERVVEEHYERDGAEELYFVATGRATFTLGDEELDAPAGTFVYAEPGTKRGALAAEPKTTSGRSKSCGESTSSTTRSLGRHPVACGWMSTRLSLPSYGSAWPSSATRASWPKHFQAGPGRRTSRTALTESSRSIRSSWKR